MKFLHVEVRVRVNGDEYSYRDPQGMEDISFSVPVDLFDAKKISNIFPQMIAVADGKFELAKAEQEMNSEE